MLSNQTICNGIRFHRLYKNTNCVSFSKQHVIDEEGGRCISFRLYVTYNKQTDGYTVSSAVIYGNRYIGPRKYGKQNCNDPVFVKKYSEAHLETDRKCRLRKHNPGVEA